MPYIPVPQAFARYGVQGESMKLTMDGRELSFKEGQTLLDVASANGIYIPTLCWHPKTGQASRCRVCVVEVDGMRGLQTSCSVAAREGMVVRTDSSEVKSARRMTVQRFSGSSVHRVSKRQGQCGFGRSRLMACQRLFKCLFRVSGNR